MKTSRYVPLLLVSMAVLSGCDSAVEAPPRPDVVQGTIPLREISGATFVGDALLVAADDRDKSDPKKDFRMVALVPKALTHLEKNDLTIGDEMHLYEALATELGKGKKGYATDFEDIALGQNGEVLLISSHSRSRWKEDGTGEKREDDRMRVITIQFDLDNVKKPEFHELKPDLIGKLPASVRESEARVPGHMEDKVYKPGFNIEGAVFTPEGDLLLGLRSPVDGENRALLLRVKDLKKESLTVSDPVPLPLNPHLSEEAKKLGLARGIRGMAYDEVAKGYWIIAGLAPDHDEKRYPEPGPPNDWSLWFWDGKEGFTEHTAKELGLEDAVPNPEAVCVVPGASRRLLLISDDGDKVPTSRYALFPAPESKTDKAKKKPAEPEPVSPPKDENR